MKFFIRTLGIAGGVFLIASVQNVSAQVLDPVEFTTTFPFTVGAGTVPAGSYTIRPDDENPGILELQGRDRTVFFEANNMSARTTPKETEVVFKRYGDGYILKDVWVAGSDTGAESVSAEGERQAAAKYSATGEERVQARKRGHATTSN
jgi:hypothetical protein